MDSASVVAGGATVLSWALHRITPSTGQVEPVVINASVPHLGQYLTSLLAEIGEQGKKRSFGFQSPTSEFRTCLGAYVNTRNLAADPHSLLLAQRLLRQEIATMEKYKNINEITKGSFLQFLYEEGGGLCYLGVKVDHQSFLDETDFTRKSGLAEDRRLYKACRVNFEGGKARDVYVYDTNGAPAAYWWREFLELQVLRDDLENTKTAAVAVMAAVGTLKRNYPADHTILRNAAVAAFKQKAEMDYGQFIGQVFETYEPVDSAAAPAIRDLLEKLRELPTKKKFDTQFSIVPAAVPFKKTTYRLTPEIALTLDDGITNLDDKVWREVDDDGRELVVIHSHEAKSFRLKQRG